MVGNEEIQLPKEKCLNRNGQQNIIGIKKDKAVVHVYEQRAPTRNGAGRGG